MRNAIIIIVILILFWAWVLGRYVMLRKQIVSLEYKGVVYKVVQQPLGKDDFVSNEENVITQYGRAKNFGFLAHEQKFGQMIDKMTTGERIIITPAIGKPLTYYLYDAALYKAITPDNLYSNFKSWGGMEISSSDLFEIMYSGKDGRELTLQTCYPKDNKITWGRYFVSGMEIGE